MNCPSLERPFYFVVVVWGRAYSQSLLDYCVASLLSSGNLPSLKTRRRSKFLVATLPSDWTYISSTPIFRELAEYVDPIFVEIPPCPHGRSACEHMGIGHKTACDMAIREGAYVVILTPDCMLSDGTVANLQQHAYKGIQLVWVAALRFAEEPFLAYLKAWGLLPSAPPRETRKALTISGADMVRAGTNSLHSETLSYEWDAVYFPHLPSAVWWRIPGEVGMLVYSLSWAPLLLDTTAIKRHDTSALDTWTIDGDYVFRNLGESPRIHVVQDSDEAFISSWGRTDDRAVSLAPRYCSPFKSVNYLLRACEFRDAYFGPYFDPLKRKNFLRPVRWHAYPLTPGWRAVERKSRRTLKLVLGEGFFSAANLFSALDAAAKVLGFIFRLKMLLRIKLAPPAIELNRPRKRLRHRNSILTRFTHIRIAVSANRKTVVRRLCNLWRREDRARVLWRVKHTVIYITLGRGLPEPFSVREQNEQAAVRQP